MYELITRKFYPEEDEDLGAALLFVKTMHGCQTAVIVEDHIDAVFRVKII